MMGEARAPLREFSSQLVGEVARTWFMPLIPELRRLKRKDGQGASHATHDSHLCLVQGCKSRYRGWGSHHFASLLTSTLRTTTPCSRHEEGQVTAPNLLAPISLPLSTKQALSLLQAIVAARLGRMDCYGKGDKSKGHNPFNSSRPLEPENP